MLSIPNRAAVCFFGVALSGCMQSMPTAETITRPTMEAFTRLSSWTPWRSSPEQPPPVVITAQNPLPAVEPVEQQAAAPELRKPPKPKPAVPVPQLASSRARPVTPAPAIVPAAVVIPAAAAAPVVSPPTASPLLPARVNCQTASQPGERVRMECTPVE
ncbi:hypothetical protein [Bosea sp. NBC_00550]|uniref:hypothetical protein n=1 Tax=Bosea sp. NBC_00550 TaxID=2969621 RepID=UPI00222EA78C|nr:hypothetical protein [Bosea sp. NBC_00550]UZF92247.1 hypothetical protein NWE53_24820 [Bosea sp. NBC_00550]